MSAIESPAAPAVYDNMTPEEMSRYAIDYARAEARYADYCTAAVCDEEATAYATEMMWKRRGL
jgi:hypothetical protein